MKVKKFLKFVMFFDFLVVVFLGFFIVVGVANFQNPTSESVGALLFSFLWTTCIFLGVNIYYYSMAVSFEICGDKIVFTYFNGKQRLVEIADVIEVFAGQARYTFKTRNKKIYLGRITGVIKIERDINPIIVENFSAVIK